MNPAVAAGQETVPPDGPGVTPRRRLLRSGENLLLLVALGAMMGLPVLEIILRTFFKTGISDPS